MVYSSFPIGSEIEVRSNEEGFKGAWFEAKVVSYIPRCRKYTILFSNFVSEDDPSKPLVDSVYHKFVRPRPPRSDVKTLFAKYDLVEALLNDGWWKGVVSGLPRGKGVVYRVCFPNTREELECRREDMREQLEWVQGEWTRVQDMEGCNVFDVGSRVEVSRYKKNCGAAWYVGTVLKVIGNNNLLVEYESINDISKKMPLKEIVDLQYVRPFPPPLLKFDNLIDVLEEVEVCHNGGWVRGVVSKILPGSRYVVKWKHHREEIELDQSALRPCYDWTNERWVHINKDKSGKRKSLLVEGPTIASSALTFRVNDSEVAVEKSEELKIELGIETSLPSKKLKTEMPLEGNLKLTDIAKLIGHRRKSDRINSLIHCRKKWFPTGRQSKLHAQEQNSENNNGESANGFGIVNCGSETTSTIGKSSSDDPLLKEGPTLLVQQQHPPAQLNVGTKSAEVCHEQDISRVNGDDSINGAEGSCFLGDASQYLSKNFGHLPVRDEAADFLPIADLGNYKACRGLTKNTEMQKLAFDHKIHIFDVADVKQHAEERKKHNLGISRKKKIAYINVNVKQCQEDSGKKNKVGRPPKEIICVNCNENEHIPEERKAHRGRPKKLKNINDTKSKLEEEERIMVGNEYGRQFVEPTDQTLTVDASEKVRESKNSLLAVNADGRSTDANEVTDTFLHIMATIDLAPVASDHNHEDRPSIDPSPSGSSLSREENLPDHGENLTKPTLPFTKESAMWETIESMEAFRTMPQHPHFHPLEQYEGEFREGMAIGLMVTFASLAASIQKLRITDSQDIFEEKLKALTPLELNGFDVKLVRTRLEKLMEIRNGAGQFECRKLSLKEGMVERGEEKEELDMLISAHDKLILDLEENLDRCRKKKMGMVWGSRKKESEIEQLRMDLQATEEAFCRAEGQFNTCADARW